MQGILGIREVYVYMSTFPRLSFLLSFCVSKFLSEKRKRPNARGRRPCIAFQILHIQGVLASLRHSGNHTTKLCLAAQSCTMHSCYRGRGEHLFGLTHPFGLMRQSWDGRDATGHAKEGLSRVTQHARRLSARVQHLYDIHQGSCDSPFLPNVMMHLFDLTDMQCLY